MGRFTKSEITMATTSDHLLVTLRIDRENHMYGRLASESVVENMFTPVHDDNLKTKSLKPNLTAYYELVASY